jgi:hypothetical protein
MFYINDKTPKIDFLIIANELDRPNNPKELLRRSKARAKSLYFVAL